MFSCLGNSLNWVVVLLVEDAVPFSFLLMASAPAATSASATAPSACAAAVDG
jgi:hypothetical protein